MNSDKEPNPFIYATVPVAGLDLSLRSPALAIISPTTEPSFLAPISNCKFAFLTDRKQYNKQIGLCKGTLFGAWGNDGERYETIAEWVVSTLKANNCNHIGIEGYAYSGKFNSLTGLAENLGLLKYFLYKNNITYDIYPPSLIKKASTGHGNADKQMMVSQFILDTGYDILKDFHKSPTDKPISPIHDICDAYYLACSARIAKAVENRDWQAPDKPKAKKKGK